MWDGERDVAIQQGSGSSSTLQSLQLTTADDLAVRARFTELVQDAILKTGQVPALDKVRLFLFANPADLRSLCTAASPPVFCTGHYGTLGTLIEDFDAKQEDLVYRSSDPAFNFKPIDVEAIRNTPAIYFDLVASGTDGVWRLTPGDRTLVDAMSQSFGPDNVMVGFNTVTEIRDTSLEAVNLSLPGGTAVALSNGPRTGLADPLPLWPITDLDAGTGQQLYATTGTTRLKVSANAGATWTDAVDSRLVKQLAVNPANRAHLLAVFAQTTANANHVGLSTNGGASWVTLTMPATALGNGGIAWAAFDPFTAGKIYAFGNGRLLTSLNSGSTWTDAALTFTPGEPAFSTVAGTLYAVSQTGGNRGVWKSTNGGGSWTRLTLTPSSSQTLYLAHGTQGEALFVAEDRRVHRSVDGGQTWASADVLASGTITSLAVGPDPCTGCTPVARVYAGTDRGIYFSAGGAIWSRLLNLSPAAAAYARVTAIVPGTPLAFGTAAGVWTYHAGEQTATQLFDASGGFAMVALTGVSSSSVTTDVDWISLVTGSSIAAGDATVVFQVGLRPDSEQRTGYVEFGGRTLAASQAFGTCTYSLSAQSQQVAAGGTSGSVAVTTQTGCGWTVLSNATFIGVTGSNTRSGTGALNFTVAPNTSAPLRVGTISLAGRTFTISQEGPPTLTAAKSSLRFAAVRGASTLISKTANEAVRLTQNGAGTLTWTASANQPWLTVTSPATIGTQDLSIGVQFASTLPASGTVTGTVTVTATGTRSDTLATITITLDVRAVGTTAPPEGFMDTPSDNATGITGSIPVTGWVVDDIGIVRVRIMRDPVAGEGSALVFLGDAVQVDGARPDVVAFHPTRPQVSRAGWGYLLLTNFLPNLGNGTFRLHAYGDDADGNSRLLGSRTITCTNSAATLPFGAIDTPTQGQIVSGTVTNFGWVLSPGARRADPPNGTVNVLVDGVTIGSPSGWTARSDLSALFPAAQFAGIARALGVFGFDSTALANGVHTISWLVTDNQGGATGVGSRYFTVTNGSSLTTTAGERPSALRASVLGGPPARAIEGRRGFDLTVPLQRYEAGGDGRIVVQSEELDRVELRLGPGARGVLRTPAGSQELPIGSRLDPDTGIFTWQPGVAFVGPYDFAFDSPHSSVNVQIVLNPKGSGRVGPQAVIDMPSTSDSVVDSTFTVAGWAVDLDTTVDTGVDTVHVWAYPAGGATRAAQADPIFLGAAVYGGERPDVAAIYGDRFLKSGYGLAVGGLQAGTYDIAVFPYSTAKHRFTPAKVVRVRIGEEK